MPAPEPAVAATTNTSHSNSESPASAQVVANPEPTLAQLGVPEHALLVVAWLACSVLAWLPLLLALTFSYLLLAWSAASYVLLQSGAFSAPDGKFLSGVVLGTLYALAAGVGGALRLVARPKAQRERLIGPGGRVLRVIMGRPTPKSRFAEWFPDAPILLFSAALLVVCQVWMLRRPSAGSLTISLVVASLIFLSLSWLANGLLEWGSSSWATYRFAHRTQYRAGLLSGLFLMISLGAGLKWWGFVVQVRSTSAAQHTRDALSELVVNRAPPTILRTLLFETAEVLWAKEATQEGVRHLIGQLVERTAYENPDESSWLSMDALPRLAQVGGIVFDGELAPTFARCIKELFPTQITRVKDLPSFRSFRLDDDTEHDILLGAVLQICEIHAFRRPYDNLGQVLERAAVNGAIDSKRRGKRLVAGDPDEEYLAVCPNPYAAPDSRIAAEQELARINWGALKPIQKAIILEKAVLELDDDEIADNHHMPRSRVKDTYQNSIRKIRNKLVAACP